MEKYTPMMEQYLKTKEENKDSILFYRLGDFYEMFFDDAILVSRELELVLTGKSCGVSEKAPMCGVPFHAAEGYISKLVEKGYKVAICEQTEDPKLAKGLVKREVVRTVTPGTHMEGRKDESCFIACIINLGDAFGLSISDVATGEFIMAIPEDIARIRETLLKYEPREILLNDSFLIACPDISDLGALFKTSIFTLNKIETGQEKLSEILASQFEGFSGDMEGVYYPGIVSSGNLLLYLFETQKNDLSHINRLSILNTGKTLLMDAFSFRNLEILEPLRRDDKKGCLFHIMDHTKTAMGRRLLRTHLRAPLIDKKEINHRLDGVSDLFSNPLIREELSEYLKDIYDIERLIGRISYKSANPRDILALKGSIENLPYIKEVLKDCSADLLIEIRENLDDLRDIYNRIDSTIDEEAPVSTHDGDIIKAGFNERVDSLKKASRDGKSLLSELEEKERERTGIKNLRIRYNRVFGYYIEVTNSYLSMIPDNYIRRQTLANGERFFTEELKALEDDILGAKEKLNRLEFELYNELLDMIRSNERRIQNTASMLARLDVTISMATLAVKNNYVRPGINKKGIINIKGGRHPVVEKMQYPQPFIDNDTYLDNGENQIYLITGPNMAGKSTYMRQCALIVLMAHIGSFVPAKSADIGIVDRIFTRIGASDDLARGQSTFMVEMNEMANILNNATKDSLIILDEIGRGTSTYDGLSIAWSVIEHIADNKKLGAKTLFATHYHELTVLEDSLPCVKNYSIAVKESEDSISFIRKIIPKAADKSYGILVASIAGVPKTVTDRAKDILEDISSGNSQKEPKDSEPAPVQLSFFDRDFEADKIKAQIKDFDINNSTPMEAFMFLNNLKNEHKL